MGWPIIRSFASLSLSLSHTEISSHPFFLSDFWAINRTTSRYQSLEKKHPSRRRSLFLSQHFVYPSASKRIQSRVIDKGLVSSFIIMNNWFKKERGKERETFLICRFVSLQNFLFLEGYKNEKSKNNASVLKQVYKAKHQGTSTKTELKTKTMLVNDGRDAN